MFYTYYMTERPPMPGSCPRGIIGMVEYEEPKAIDGVGSHVYAEITFERELRPSETEGYELVYKEKGERIQDGAIVTGGCEDACDLNEEGKSDA